jgi:Asp-tRNA(Asn)/Glu-tRNA(Gln) amidotransferase A subunit family amidase
MSMHHVVSRSVRDSAAVLDATHGAMGGDAYWAPPAGGSYTRDAQTDPGPLRIGFVSSPASGADVDPRCLDAARRAAELCEALGHHVEDTQLPPVGEDVAEVQAVVIGVNIAATILDRAAAAGREPGEHDLEAFTQVMFEHGRKIPGTRYVQAVRRMHRVGRVLDAMHERYDVLCMPTLARLPAELGVLRMDDVSRFIGAIAGYTPFTVLQNVTGQPAMSVPLAVRDGLPVGTMFAARFGDERTLFRLAGQLERAAPWGMPH